MTNYTKTTDFAAKDSLPSGDSGKIIRGAEFGTEFDNIQTAVNSKSNIENPSFTGNITVTGTVDGRDIAADGTKLDTVETSADVTDTANVTAAGAVMDSELTDITAVKALNQGVATTDSPTFAAVTSTGNVTVGGTVDGRDVAADGTKLDTVETNADVTDTTNVTAAGALMDSEVTNLAQVKAFDSADYATAAQGTTADNALPKTGGAMTGAITTNSTFDGRDVATDGTKLDGIEALADVTDTTNVTAAGALMDSELTDIAAVKALNQGVATTDSPTFAGATVNGTVEFDGLSGTGAVTVTDILDQDNMSSNSATALATQQSIKSYVDSQVATADTLAEVLANGNTTGGTAISLASSDILGTGNINITGAVTADGLTINDAGTIQLTKNTTSAGDSLGIIEFHDEDGSASADAGKFQLQAFRGADKDSPEFKLIGSNSSGVLQPLLVVNSTGIDVTGTVTADGLTVDGTAKISAQTNGAYALRVGDAAGSSGSVSGIGKIGINPQSAGSFTYTGAEIRATENSLGDYRTRLSFHTRGDTSDVEPLERLRIANNGDVSLFEDTGTTAKFFWDASAESLGIGTSSISTSKLHVQGTTGTASAVRVESTAADSDAYYIADNDASVWTWGIDGGNGDAWTLSNAFGLGTPKLTVETSGNVGIGTDSPSYRADILATDQYGLRLNTTDADGCFLAIQTNGTAKGYLGSSHHLVLGTNSEDDITLRAENNLQFASGGGTEAMRIDSSQNLLVGKTSASSATVGFQAGQDGFIAATRASGQPLVLNRTTTDGIIADFRKSGSTVGSIGTAGSRVYISGPSASLHSGLIFTDNGSHGIIAPSTNAGAIANGTTDLGYSGGRFKDLYLSGGVYLGGVAVANKLDDYEEGTWTPELADATTGGNTATIASADGTYTKVGRLVTVGCRLHDIDTSGMTGANALYIRGLPFTTSATTRTQIGSVLFDRISFSGFVVAFAVNSNPYVLLYKNVSGAQDAALAVSDITTTGSDINFTLQYEI